MSEHRALLLDSVERMLSERCSPEVVAAAEGAWPAELWDVLEEAGLPLACVDEDAGGGGASLGDALAVARVAAGHAAPVPLGETGLLAGSLLAAAGLAVPAGPLAAGWRAGDAPPRLEADGRLSGELRGIPWARHATGLAVLAGREGDAAAVVLVDRDAARVAHAENMAGEPRDDVDLDGVVPAAVAAAPDALDAEGLEALGALLRAVQIAGGLAAALELSVTYAREREQFGRPIGRFQAVQHMLAELAAEAAAARAAADLAVEALEREGLRAARLTIAAAKVRAGQAATRGSEIAHQVHGAIGYTDEHRLHHVTRRLAAWRDEHGAETVWARELGAAALAHPEGPWPAVTALGSP